MFIFLDGFVCVPANFTFPLSQAITASVLVLNKRIAQRYLSNLNFCFSLITSKLKNDCRAEIKDHKVVHRPWGNYESISEGEQYKVKRIIVNPGASLSLQEHRHRAEHWIVARGIAHITKNEEQFLLYENQSTYIAVGTKHRLSNPGKIPLELIEVQTGSYLEEDDIIRHEDIYGRHAALDFKECESEKVE